MNEKKTPKTPGSAADAAAEGWSEKSFEAALADLQKVVSELEQGDLGLSDSLARYEQGIRLLKHCFGELEAAEGKLELLKSVGADGQPDTESFQEAQMTLQEKAAARGTRRSRAPRSSDE
jgi:exodeoxyribonuclease VII small subunit